MTGELLAVASLQADYAQCIDADALERWPDFFTEDGLYRITTAFNEARGLPIGVVHCAGRAMLVDRVLSLREANVYEAQSYRHILSLPRLLRVDGDGIRAETPFLVVRIMRDGTTDLFATGHYADVIVHGDGGLRFARKVAVLDSDRIDTLLALPI